MLKIEQVTEDSKQRQSLILPDGTTVVVEMRFVPLQYCWVITELTYGTFQIFNFKIFNSPNMLHQYRNQIQFGMACISKQGRDPQLQEDFVSGYSTLYILTAAEVEEFTEFLSGQT